MDPKSAFSNVRLTSKPLIRKLLNRFEAKELANFFSLDLNGASKPAIIKTIFDRNLSDGISLAQVSDLDIEYEWSLIAPDEEGGRLKASKKEWEAYELIFPEEISLFSRVTEADSARSNPRQLQNFLHLELDSYFQNYCSVKTHQATGAVWIRIQLAESDTQKRAALISKTAVMPVMDEKTQTTTMPEWWPSPANTIYLIYFLNSAHFLAGPIKKEFKQYILNAISSALGAKEHRECELRGKDILGLKELLLQRESQGNFRALRTKRTLFDANPLDRTARVMNKKAKIKETDLQITDPSQQVSSLEPKNVVVVEESQLVKDLERQVENVFGVSMQPKIQPTRPNNPFARRAPQPSSSSELPVLSTLQVQFLNEPYRGFIPSASDVACEGDEIDTDQLADDLRAIKINCKISISGPSIIEGFKQAMSSNCLVVGTEYLNDPVQRQQALRSGKPLPGLAPFIENLQSMAKNNFVFDRDLMAVSALTTELEEDS